MPVRRVPLLLLLPLLSAQPPDSATLARQAVEAEVRQFQQLGEYTFEFHSTYRSYSKNGALRRQTVTTGETYMSHRRNVDIVLARDGRPLKPNDLEKRRKAAARQLEADARARQSPAYAEKPLDQRAGPGFQRNNIRMSGVDILRYCRLSPPASFQMKFSACQSPWPAEAHYAHLHGDIVIDPATRLIHSWRAFSPANALVFEYTSQSAPAGARLLASLHFRPFAAPEIYRDTVEFLYRWSNPQRFTVAVEQSIAAPAEKN